MVSLTIHSLVKFTRVIYKKVDNGLFLASAVPT